MKEKKKSYKGRRGRESRLWWPDYARPIVEREERRGEVRTMLGGVRGGGGKGERWW